MTKRTTHPSRVAPIVRRFTASANSTLAGDPTNVRRDENVIFLEREVSRVEQVDLDVLEVGAVGLGALDGEDRVALVSPPGYLTSPVQDADDVDLHQHTR
jgi:hypothetical protein